MPDYIEFRNEGTLRAIIRHGKTDPFGISPSIVRRSWWARSPRYGAPMSNCYFVAFIKATRSVGPWKQRK